MPRIRFTGPYVFNRVVGPYQWNRQNGFVCQVAAEDVAGLITLPGFELDEKDDLRQIQGIGQAREQELHLMGIATFRQLAEADVDTLLKPLGALGREQVEKWQQQATALAEGGEDMAPAEIMDNHPDESG